MEHLRQPLETAKHAWPGVEVSSEALISFLRSTAPTALESQEACAQLAFADLYGVCACLARDEAALALLRTRIGEWVKNAVNRLQLGSGDVSDVEAKVIDILVVGDKLSVYDGRAELKTWVRVIAVRTALNHKRERKREAPLPDSLLMERAEHGDPELAYFRQLYAAEVKAAFSRALSELPLLDRNMLKSYVLDGLTMEQVGALYGLHSSNVSRRLAEAQGDLRSNTRKQLASHLAINHTEVESIIQSVRSLLEASLQRLLR